EFQAFDVLELFAFTHPTTFTVPTVKGLSKVLGLNEPAGFEDTPPALFDIAKALLTDLQNDPLKDKADALKIAGVMGLNGKGWGWSPFVFEALGETYDPALPYKSRAALNIWKKLPQWAEEAPEPPPSHEAVAKSEALSRLSDLLGETSEKRPQQVDYTAQITSAFLPPLIPPASGGEDTQCQGGSDRSQPHVVLAEAGTGVGKTLGYLAPASVWAEKNKGSVWISTFTKNLQRQIDQELNRLYPDAELKDKHVSVRKGRENYLCLLNLEETAAGSEVARYPNHAIAAGIMARWAAASKDGDLSGGDFPGWLPGLLGFQHTSGLADRRGECIYSACDHYHKCFVERSVRKAKRAKLVVANHALVMIQTALSNPGDEMPSRYIFDEGHHLFNAADSAFAAHLSAQETTDLRRWLLGADGSSQRSRARGLKLRLEDLIVGDGEAEKLLQDILHGAAALTASGWTRRLKEGNPSGPCEKFLLLIYKQVHVRSNGREGPYSLETQTRPLVEGLEDEAAALKKDLVGLNKPMSAMIKFLRKKLADDKGDLNADTRKRLDAVAQALEKRARLTIAAWIDMLGTLYNNKPRHPVGASAGRLHERDPEKTAALPLTYGSPPSKSAGADRGDDGNGEFIDWMGVERIDGRAIDVGLYRHYIDPMKAFAAAIEPHMQGMVVTSATLLDGTGDAEKDWKVARQRTGVNYLSLSPQEIAFTSPFDYNEQTKIFIINDVRKDDLGQVSGAYRALFEASGGGALGLFTAISRLRAVHDKIALSLEESGLSLYSQHVDDIDAGTLVDMFRDDVDSCLLGTDAVRDGVDVPGESLRLIVFDRVPWPRPTILHKARREAFGGRAYDEMITRLKLKQAFGRLIRRSNDKGVFVMLDSGLPSKLFGAFPEGVEVRKVGLSEAVAEIKEFLRRPCHPVGERSEQ
ncbi:MAG TPA: ATP-dependent DNA helicase, partial [Rhizobiales bacterium]|nr:ATP-dependent DNA helicase [Hyphomicrobiales bacterium]